MATTTVSSPINLYDHITLYRDVMAGGHRFVNNYLNRYTTRESESQFVARKKMTYNPGAAKRAVNTVIGQIINQMHGVQYYRGTKKVSRPDYPADAEGRTFVEFMGQTVLRELLTTGAVGIYVDRDATEQITMLDNLKSKPYAYIYRIEDVQRLDAHPRTRRAVLRDEEFLGSAMSVVGEKKYTYRELQQDGDVVRLKTYKRLPDTNTADLPKPLPLQEFDIRLPFLPFRLFNIQSSLLIDAAAVDVAALNLNSSLLWLQYLVGNPMYCEHSEPIQTDGLGNDVSRTLELGLISGRTYTKEPPRFISPDPEAISVQHGLLDKMEKAADMLVRSVVEGLGASGDGMTLYDSGLAAICLVLERIENYIHMVWSSYLGDKDEPLRAEYPKHFNVHSGEGDTETLLELLDKTPSPTGRRELVKALLAKLIGCQVTSQVLTKINEEIDKSKYLSAKASEVAGDVEAGYLTRDLAAEIRGYPKGEAEKAEEEHVKRLQRIAASQGAPAQGGVAVNDNSSGNPASHGLSDHSPTPQTDKKKAREEQGGGREGTGENK